MYQKIKIKIKKIKIKSKEKYKIINKTNQLLFYVKNPILAYKFNERYNNKIKANSSYSNSNCSLIFNNDTKKNNTSLNISHNYSYFLLFF